MNLTRRDYTYDVNFGVCFSGLLDKVYYTVFKDDGSVFIARTKVNIIDFGLGKYGISLNIELAGSYHIQWDIDGTKVTAQEAIYLYDGIAFKFYQSYGS